MRARQLYTVVVVSAAAAMALAGCGRSKIASDHELPVCITGSLNIAGVKPGDCLKSDALARLIDAPVQQGPNVGAVFSMTDPADASTKQEVSTCRQYDDRKSRKWYALTGLDMAKEGWFQRVCGTIDMLVSAQPSKRSFLGDGLADPKLVSAAILPSEPDTAMPPPSGTLAQLVSRGDVTIASAQPQRLDLAYMSQHVVYEELARGDLDHDGVEDSIVFMGVSAVDGTMRWYRSLALTRKSSGAALEPVGSKGS